MKCRRATCAECGREMLPSTAQRCGGICMLCFRRANFGRNPEQIGHVAEFPCPCCGYLTLDEPGAYRVCPICFWEDDPIQLVHPFDGGGCNGESLLEAQRNFERHGCCMADPSRLVRPVESTDRRDPGWRPIDPQRDPHPIVAREWKASCGVRYYWRESSD